MKPPRGILFDLFHTLTARESEWSSCPMTSDLLGIDRREWDRVLLESSRWRLVGEERDPYRIFRRLVDEVAPSMPEERIREVFERRIGRFRDCFRNIPAPNVEMLERLRHAGFRLALLSNADAMEAEAYRGCRLEGRFDVELFSCDAGSVKPEPEIFHACLDRLGLPASECLFVGDGGSDELQGAKAVGLRTVFVSGIIEELWPERIDARRAVADHHVRWAHEVEDLCSSAISA